MNRILTENDELCIATAGGEKLTFLIQKLIGRGASCAVYLADLGDHTRHILKEYNPANIELVRDDGGTLSVVNCEKASLYAEGLARFRSAAERQKNIRYSIEDLTNSTSNIQAIYESNGTAYIDMTEFHGCSYDKLEGENLHDVLSRMLGLAFLIKSYHANGYLHLDIKPENIFALPETNQMVMLFDFDSVVEKSMICHGAAISSSAGWAAPEQVMLSKHSKICEASDLYAIGEIVFYRVFGRHSADTEKRSFSSYDYDYSCDLLKNVNPRLFPVLTDFFHHTICVSVSKRYQSADEMIPVLKELVNLSDPKEPYLVSTNVTAEDFFIGRENELKIMDKMLSESKVLVLCGMGGIGKSELARNYVNQFKKNYDTVFFSTYLSGWSMLLADDYRIQIANFKPYEGESPDDYFERKMRKLKELCTERTLFVIDNVNEDEYDEHESSCFRKIMELPCRFLFTSRLQEWSYPTLDIGALEDRRNLVKLFDKWCPIKSDEQRIAVNEIIDYVDSHTLTLELIAKQTAAGFSTPAKMLEKLKKHGMIGGGKEKVKSVKDLETSRKTAFEHICALFDMAELTDGEKYIMANMALIPSTGINAHLFMEWCEIEDADEINLLIEKGWINRDDELIRLHPVIAEVSLHYHYDFELGETVMLKNATKFMAENFLSFSPGDKKYSANFSMEMSRTLISRSLCSGTVGQFLYDVSETYYEYRNLNDMLEVGQYVLTIFSKLYGEKNSYVAKSLNFLGAVYEDKGDYDSALTYYEKALSIRTALFGEEHLDVAESLNNLGELFNHKGDYSAALKFHEQALAIRMKLDKDGPTVAVSINNIGCVLGDKNDIDTARQYFERALNMRMKLFGEYSSEVANSLNCLGATIGDLDLAQQYCERALKIRLKLFGENNFLVTTSMINVSTIYDDNGDHETAFRYCKQALAIRKKLLGEIHPDVAYSIYILGTIQDNRGDLESAISYYKHALSIYKECFNENHPDITKTQAKLDSAQLKQQRSMEKNT